MEKEQKEGVFEQKGAEKGKNRDKNEEKEKEGLLKKENWKRGIGEVAGGKKLEKVSKKELERQKERLRKADEKALGEIWGGRIPLKEAE